MDSNFVIKVKYRDTLRRFSARINDHRKQLDLNMSGLRAKIIGLFNFPLDAELTLTYIDEDDDAVTLVDDNDLCDVMRQHLKFFRIDVQLNNDKLDKPYAGSNRSSTPLRSPSVQPPLASFNAGVADVLKAVPETIREALSEAVLKLSFDVASKAPFARPGLGDFVDCLSKMGQSCLSPLSNAGATGDSSMHIKSSESPCASSAPTGPDPSRDGGLQAVLPDSTAVGSNCKASKEANSANVTRGAVDLNADPSDANLSGCTSIPAGPSASNNFFASCENNNTKDKKVPNKGKSVSFNTSSPFIDASRNYYPVNEMGCNPLNERPFSRVPLANDSVVPPFSYHPSSPSKRSCVSAAEGNVMFSTFHKGIQCDGCGVIPITGPQFKSKVKDEYDLCSICFSKMGKEMGKEADFIRMGRPVHYQHQWHFRASNDSIPMICGPSPLHVLRNGVLKSAWPKLDSRFILDVNVPDGTVMAPSMPFTKIWRIRNNGTLPWSRSLQLVWTGGDKLRSALSVDLEIPADGIPVNGELDIAVDFTAPQLPGIYISYWRMASQSGIKFGQRFWVLIHVDMLSALNVSAVQVTFEYDVSMQVNASMKDGMRNNLQGLNLNLPPESNGPRNSGIVDMNVDIITELVNSNNDTETVKSMFNENSAKESIVNDSVASTPVASSSSVTYPIVDQVAAVPVFTPAVSLAVAFPTSDQCAPAPIFPHNSSSSVSYPCIDLSEEAGVAGPSQVPPSAVSVQVPSEEDNENFVEQNLLKELEEMGFKQVELNKKILRMNDNDLQKSVEDLCAVAEWDPIIEELQAMGLYDEEMYKKLLKKNKGSIKGVVMDLLAGERALNK